MPKDNETIALSQAAVVSPVVTFRDKVFRSRTVVFQDGDAVTVERGVVAVSKPEYVTFLNEHADFERVDRSA
jgi:hypothetical protein